MITADAQKDLVFLVANTNLQYVIKALLSLPQPMPSSLF
jgi:hypothetical protein